MMAKSQILDHPFGAAYAKRGGVAAPWEGALPGPKVEEWRFTPLRSLAKIPFVPAATAADVDVTALPHNVPTVAGAARLVLVNGVYRKDLSDHDFGTGVTVTPQAKPGTLATALTALNQHYAPAGIDLYIAGAASKVIHVISIGAAGAEPAALHPHLSVDLAPGAALTLVESHVGLPGQTYFSNAVVEISVGEKATVRRYVTVAEDSEAFHIATSAVKLAAGGTFEGFHLGLGGALVRQEIHVALQGEGANVKLNGAYALTGASHHDFTTVMDHAVPHCTSSQVFKGVVDGESRGVYQGRVHVARDAQKTDARQLHKALFLSRGPQVDCKPELEIYADDVQCAHGATTGEIDPNHMFYLESRGIDPETARMLLVEGFLADVVTEISNEDVREIFGNAIGTWLKKVRA